jgi:AcrR family transcriptional regulator
LRGLLVIANFPAVSTTRQSADARRESIVAAALPHFARDGYRGASTDAIARDAGVSQPYVFRLFGSKRALFLACCAHNLARIHETFTAAAAGVPREERLHAMGQAYLALLGDREDLLVQLQGYAASADPEIRDAIRWGYGELVDLVRRETGASDEELWTFFARGMLLSVAAALDLPDPGELLSTGGSA